MGRLDKPGVDIRRLRYFVAVCDNGGFSKAAPVIGIAQPALTRQVQLLEHELGMELFTRNGRNAVPTEAGAALMSGARLHLESLDLLIERVQRDFGAGPAHVSLGVCPTISPLFLAPLYEALRQSAPTLTLTVIEAYSGDLRSLMACGRLHLALTYSQPDTEGLDVTNLLSEKLVLAGPRQSIHPLSLNDLSRQRLILPSAHHQLRRIIDAVAATRGIPLVPALELDSLNAVKAMLDGTSGDFATILPYHSVATDAAEGRFSISMISDPDMVRTIALLRPSKPEQPLPKILPEAIFSRAKAIQASLEAVF
ncbi:LysR family transcriptional regulator [Pseudotabrizicola sp. 4114]|uniref:LysR family transcriptional regulator n=1 Tax=Pseudotabrizicola sp. 4114 TaxID=2817731 RepID=UPI002863BCD0|nr:LysR family nitrogen assimilation transcriptional regulator [Pseudorhodobacter sp. 4114]